MRAELVFPADIRNVAGFREQNRQSRLVPMLIACQTAVGTNHAGSGDHAPYME